MNFDHKIISISGNARVGKDTVANAMIEILADFGIQAQKLSFAYELRKSVDDFLQREIGISAFTEDPDEKLLIRPFLVTWGTDIMRKINEDVWIERIQSSLNCNKVNIISDLRFENELNFVKQNKGLSLFLSRDGIEPANEHERKNNQILINQVDLHFTMMETSDENLIKCIVNETLNNLINEEIFEIWKATCH
jgi:hypothetical protein